MLNPSTRLRLEMQLDVVPLLFNGSSPEVVIARPASGQWSAHEHLAHLARHHAVFLERLQQILHEHRPPLSRYRAEEDPAWPEWSCLSTEEVLGRLTALRGDIIQLITGLTEAQTSRVGVHPLFGDMSLAHWVEFFLLHEAHHLYMVMIRLGQAKRI
jgi:uncharacterized damage-inducible protein DinB